ncbi:unnamed protein product [Lactuca virosa]|uniref:Uncharacterized protein n=1 Tax=Lactuca virosa TaxID=75947 RepID=A0AAU9MBB5_9ASTR|nr:unnamed protein product [Lactuca virosa]
MKLLLASEATMRSGEGEERPRRKKKKKSEGRKFPLSVGHQSKHPSESIEEIRKRKEGARSRLRKYPFTEGQRCVAGNTLSPLLHSALEVFACRVWPVVEEEEEEE